MTDEDETARKRVQALVVGYGKAMPSTTFDNPWVKSLRVVSAATESATNTNAKVTFAFKTPSVYTNNPGPEKTAHGGAIATFLDNCTSAAQLASKKYNSQGVSRHIDVTYFRPVMEDEEVLIDAEILQISSRGAVIRGTLKRARDGVLLAVCTQEKVIPQKGGSRAFSL